MGLFPLSLFGWVFSLEKCLTPSSLSAGVFPLHHVPGLSPTPSAPGHNSAAWDPETRAQSPPTPPALPECHPIVVKATRPPCPAPGLPHPRDGQGQGLFKAGAGSADRGGCVLPASQKPPDGACLQCCCPITQSALTHWLKIAGAICTLFLDVSGTLLLPL